MADIPWAELNDSASKIGGATAAIVQNAQSAACRLYREYPGWLLNIQSSNPGGAALRGFWDRLCPAPEQQPPSPDKPFSGGQCCTNYRITWRVISPNVSPEPISVTRPGKVGSMRIAYERNSLGEISGRRFELPVGLNCPGRTPSFLFLAAQTGNNGVFNPIQVIIDSVVRTDAQPDTCGELPPQFPIILPPPDALDFNTPITIGGDTYNFNIVIPVTQFNPTVNFRPEFNVDVGGINVNFDMGGVNVDFTPEINLPSFPANEDPRSPTNRPPPVPPRPPSGGGCPDVNLQPVLNAIADVDADLAVVGTNVELLLDCDRCDRPPVESPDLGTIAYPASQSRQVSIPTSAVWIRVLIEQKPVNAKMQAGIASPDVYYCGWHSFGGGSSAGERIPINYLDNVYPVPEGASSFSFTTYTGFEASLTIYTYEEEQETQP